MNRTMLREVLIAQAGPSARMPRREEQILFDLDKSKGFGSSVDRFGREENRRLEEIGPGSYATRVRWGLSNESASKRGTGGMANRSSRKTGQIRYINTGPGPGQYSVCSDNSFSHSTTSTQSTEPSTLSRIRSKLKSRIINNFPPPKKLIRVKNEKEDHKLTLGPGVYNPIIPPTTVPGLSTVGFRSITSRISKSVQQKQREQNPAVGQYYLNRSILTSKGTDTHIPSSSFCDPKGHQRAVSSDIMKIKELLQVNPQGCSKLPNISSNEVSIPGPGHYDIQPVNFTCKQTGKVISESRRFTKVDSTSPGPGYYAAPSTFSGDKYRVFNSVFLSQTPRVPPLKPSQPNLEDIAVRIEDLDLPNPQSRHSFHANPHNLWL